MILLAAIASFGIAVLSFVAFYLATVTSYTTSATIIGASLDAVDNIIDKVLLIPFSKVHERKNFRSLS